MKMLQYQGFLRPKRGLNQLESVRKFANILNKDEVDFVAKTESIDIFCASTKNIKKEDVHWPIILVWYACKNLDDQGVVVVDKNGQDELSIGLHAVVLEEKVGENLICKNSWGSTDPEITVEKCVRSEKSIKKEGFYLGWEGCYYIDFQ